MMMKRIVYLRVEVEAPEDLDPMQGLSDVALWAECRLSSVQSGINSTVTAYGSAQDIVLDEAEGVYSKVDGWQVHAGSEQPIPDGTIVVVKYRNGATDGPHFAQSWHWKQPGAEDDVVAYKLAARGKGHDENVHQDHVPGGDFCVCEPGDVPDMVEGAGKFTTEEVQMTEAEFNALPEFQG